MTRRLAVLLVAVLASSAIVAVGVADPGDREKIRFNAADQAAARAATIRRADLTAGAWRGGVVKPDLSGPPSCPNYPVDLSSFVMTGAAASEWMLDLLFLHSEAQVLQTARMLRAEWRIQVQAPRAVACIRSAYAKALAAQGVTLVSFKQIPFPHFAPYSTSFRLVTTAATQALVVEIVAIGRSRTSISLLVTGLARDQAAIHAAALRYARILAGRIRA